MVFIIASLCILTFIIFLFVHLDKNKKRFADLNVPVSFIMPCYNDEDTVQQAIDSIYENCNIPFELIVVNDKSTDNSRDILENLKNKYKFNLIHNKHNIGKSRSLNEVVDQAKNEIIIFVDSDMIVNLDAIKDVLLRLNSNPKVAAVSCPYKPKNKGLLPLLQSIEYNMTAYIKGTYNMYSAIHLWGGFLAIKKKAFYEVGKFSVNAITEDLDLAYKLNRKGWKVEESLVKIFTYVPYTFKVWLKQRIRWTSGTMQATFRYPGTFLRNPIHLFFIIIYTYITVFSAYSFLSNLFFIKNIYYIGSYLINVFQLTMAFKLIWSLYGTTIMYSLSVKLIFMIFILPYSISSLSPSSNFLKLLLVIPILMGYMQIYIFVSIFSVFFAFYKFIQLKEGVRAW